MQKGRLRRRLVLTVLGIRLAIWLVAVLFPVLRLPLYTPYPFQSRWRDIGVLGYLFSSRYRRTCTWLCTPTCTLSSTLPCTCTTLGTCWSGRCSCRQKGSSS